MCTIYEIIWCMVPEIWRVTEFFSFWATFCSFTLLTAQKTNILKKWKRAPGDIVILHKCNGNHDDILYCSWDMVCDGCNCNFSSWADFFLPFYPVTAQKIKTLKKWKRKPQDIIILHKCTKNHGHMLYCSWDMAHDGCNYFSFWAIFCCFTA